MIEQSDLADIRAVFERWQILMNHPRARLGADKVVKIRARMAEGYTVDDCLLAVEGCAASAFHMGQDVDRNPAGTVYDSIDLIFRNSSKLDQFISMGELARKMIAQIERRQAEALAAPPRDEFVPPTPEKLAKIRAMMPKLRRVA